MFNNTTSNAIYAKDVLYVAHMNKEPKRQQSLLRLDWYKSTDREIVT